MNDGEEKARGRLRGLPLVAGADGAGGALEDGVWEAEEDAAVAAEAASWRVTGKLKARATMLGHCSCHKSKARGPPSMAARAARAASMLAGYAREENAAAKASKVARTGEATKAAAAAAVGRCYYPGTYDYDYRRW